MKAAKWTMGILAVLTAVAASAGIETFRQGVDGYAGTDDTFLQSNRGNQSTGGLDKLGLGRPIGSPRPSGNTHRILIRFDVSGQTWTKIQSASLTLTVFGVHGDAFTNLAVAVYQVSDANKDWIGGNVYANPPGANGYATWSERAEGSTPWAGAAGLATAGTDHLTPALATVSLSSADLAQGSDVTFDLDDASCLVDWAATAGANPGFLVVFTGMEADGYKQSYLEFYSSNHATVVRRPLLTVVPASSGTVIMAR